MENGSANGTVFNSESVSGKGLISELPESYNRDYYKAYKKFMKSNEVSPIGGTDTMDGFMVSFYIYLVLVHRYLLPGLVLGFRCFLKKLTLSFLCNCYTMVTHTSYLSDVL